MTSTLTTKQQYWSDHLANAERSDSSIANYARQNNIAPQTLYRWRNILRERTQTTISTETLFTQAIVFPESTHAELIVSIGDAQLNFNNLHDPNYLVCLSSLRSPS